MKKNFVLVLLFFSIMLNIFGIYFLQYPFYQEILLITIISLVILSVIPERYVFVFSINVIVGYGLFLIIHAVMNNQTSINAQMLYLFSHLLFTSVILLSWILLNYIKKTGEEIKELKLENTKLKKYKVGTDLLTIQGFNEQAKWVMSDSKINQTEAWLIEMKITNKHTKIKPQMQKTLEDTAQILVRERYDLMTSTNGRIYILLKDVSKKYVDEITETFFQKIRDKFNLIEPPVFIETRLVEEDVVQVSSKGRAK